MVAKQPLYLCVYVMYFNNYVTYLMCYWWWITRSWRAPTSSYGGWSISCISWCRAWRMFISFCQRSSCIFWYRHNASVGVQLAAAIYPGTSMFEWYNTVCTDTVCPVADDTLYPVTDGMYCGQWHGMVYGRWHGMFCASYGRWFRQRW